MSDTILVDECLSVRLVAVARERGIEAVHAAYVGKSGWQDWNLVPFALDHDYIVVTNNRRHLLREYLKYDLHNGLIIVVPNVERDDQIALFERVLDVVLGLNADMTNRLVEVLADGRVHVREWTSCDHDDDHISNPAWGA